MSAIYFYSKLMSSTYELSEINIGIFLLFIVVYLRKDEKKNQN